MSALSLLSWRDAAAAEASTSSVSGDGEVPDGVYSKVALLGAQRPQACHLLVWKQGHMMGYLDFPLHALSEHLATREVLATFMSGFNASMCSPLLESALPLPRACFGSQDGGSRGLLCPISSTTALQGQHGDLGLLMVFCYANTAPFSSYVS